MNCRGSHSSSRNLYFNYKSIATPVHPKVACSSTPASFAGNSKEKEKGLVRKNGRRGREGGKMSGSWHLSSLFYFTLLPFFLSLREYHRDACGGGLYHSMLLVTLAERQCEQSFLSKETNGTELDLKPSTLFPLPLST